MKAKKSKARLIFSGIALLPVVLLIGGFIAFKVMGYQTQPDKAVFVYSDLTRFVSTHQQLALAAVTQDSLAVMDTYLSEGSSGLKAYADEYNLDAATLLRAVRKRPAFYASLHDIVDRVKIQEATTRKAFAAFKKLYPYAVFPPTYYFIGHNAAGGTVSRAGLLIATEIYGLHELADQTEFPEEAGGRHPTTELPHLVLHELVHFNQAATSPIGYARTWDNRARAIKEGAADFMAELASGKHINAPAHAYGRAHEAELWAEYRTILDNHDTGDWFWVAPEDSTRPQDLGYFIGYCIVEAYYNQMLDKQQAVAHIIQSSDYESLLEERSEGSSAWMLNREGVCSTKLE